MSSEKNFFTEHFPQTSSNNFLRRSPYEEPFQGTKMVSDQRLERSKFQPSFGWHEGNQGLKHVKKWSPVFCQSPRRESSSPDTDGLSLNPTIWIMPQEWFWLQNHSMAPSVITMTRLFSEVSWKTTSIQSLNSLSREVSHFFRCFFFFSFLKNMTGLSQKSIPDITSFIIITHEDTTKRYLSTHTS